MTTADSAVRLVIADMAPENPSTGVKRDRDGNTRPSKDRQHKAGGAVAEPAVRNAYTAMFEGFRAELDEHHDRRERVIKASRDVTALSKKM